MDFFEAYNSRFQSSTWNERPQQPMTLIFDHIAEEIQQSMLHIGNIPGTDQISSQLNSLLNGVMLARNSPDNETIVIIILDKAMEGFLDSYTVMADATLLMNFRDCHLLVPKGLQDMRMYGYHWTRSRVTRCTIQHYNDAKYNIEIIDALVSCELIDLEQYDMGLVELMDSGNNPMAVTFAMQLVQCYCIDRGIESLVTVTDLRSTIEVLTVISAHPSRAPEGLTTLIENLYQSNWSFGVLDELYGDPTATMQSSIFQACKVDDPPGLHGKTQFLLLEWIYMLQKLPDRETHLAFATFLRQAHQLEILQTDDLISHFFRLCTEMCVDFCNRALCQQFLSSINIRAKCCFIWDDYARLLALLVKHSGGVANKINLLNKVLGIMAGVLLRDHEVIHSAFRQMPYQRIFIKLFIDLNAADPILKNINFQVLTAFCNFLHVLKPTNAPGFANAWLNLMSHRVFMDRMLVYTSEQKIWGMYAKLLIDLFKFLSPFLKNDCLENSVLVLRKTTLTVLHVLLHDFPEFLCDHHYEFCDAMSPYCIEIRNFLLSIFPRNIPVPDPFTPDMKVEMLPEIAHPPRISTSFTNMIQTACFKKGLNSYLRRGSPVTFLSKLIRNLKLNEPDCPFNYNVPLINALVLYVGTQAIDCINSKGLTHSMSTIADSKHTEFFDDLVSQLDAMGCYLFLTAISNQLTYPNSHTHYFSCLLQYLFNATRKEEIHKQIARVVLERMAVNHIYPWGLLITAIELMKNPIFKIWSQDYIHCAPEIEKLYNYVSQLEEQLSNPATHKPESADIHEERKG